MSLESLYKAYKTPLFSLAYRMLGSVMDAEDIVQEAFLSYDLLPNANAIQNERAYLYKIVTNRCLDLLRSSAKKREMYVGPWLPEPLIEQGALDADPSDAYLQRESISTAYLLLLQQLNAVERAVFLLREIFRYSYDEIAEMIGKTSANCRQIFHRAQNSIHFEPGPTPSISVAEEKVKDFVNSLMQGNTNKLLELISENVVFYSDGGGKVRAAQIPIIGIDQVIKLHQSLLKMYEGKFSYIFLSVNGQPGIRINFSEGFQYVYSFAFKNNQIQTIYSVANPDKLRHL
ncbi:RNA polymerase sigma factor SigJ [Paenibacillus eucommiae]|uniref:RNA polymerase sigma-70 factor (ECF subfamily) n=1 Tax=Paenibacillus eucommiae TaxID=1355755 RepID=A0ABS4JAV7_9BACL|nr:RNA polymerase sigma factor SigJ [Paenibacillus eucommiae]MBP1996221.1 RNA polymerase sigma-70 factor (ECF subfamily) [Paenibacillus eucommiae]